MFWIGLRNSTLYILGVVPALVLLPLLLAMLVQKHIPGITFFRSAFYTPVVASIVVVGLIWVWMLDERGLVNAVLEAVGVGSVGFLSDQWLLLLSAMAVTVWKGLGYYMIIYLAALANVPRELHEAAAVDGAGAVRRFLTVTVPAVRSTMVLVAALSSVAAFKVFSEVYLMAGPTGGPAGEDTTLVMLVQRVGTGLTGRVGYASAHLGRRLRRHRRADAARAARGPEGGRVSTVEKTPATPPGAPRRTRPARAGASPTRTAAGCPCGRSSCATCSCSPYWR